MDGTLCLPGEGESLAMTSEQIGAIAARYDFTAVVR
jgi:hypothetical protein